MMSSRPPRPWPGRFVVLEGIDGSGTTTHSKRLAKTLRKRGETVVLTCEPTNGPIGSLIRQVLQNRVVVADSTGGRPFAWSTMALLFAADRIDHLDSVVMPALTQGHTVISDRYYLSSLAYQSATSPHGDSVTPWLRSINGLAVRPDLTLVLNIDAATAAERRNVRGHAEEIFERQSLQEQLVEIYQRAGDLLPEDPIVHIDSSRSLEEVGAEILEVVTAAFREGAPEPRA
jgi:dTMP kinase